MRNTNYSSAASGKFSCCRIAAGGVNVHTLSDHRFPLPRSLVAESSVHATHSCCLTCSAEMLNDALYC